MRPLAVPHHEIPQARRHAAPFSGLVRFALDHLLILPFGAVVAILWANIGPDSYFTMSRALTFVVNDVGMAIFLALIAQEIWEEITPGGALHTWRRWMLPLLAAVGGAIGSALTYLIYVRVNYEEFLEIGWPAATAVDVAFVFFIARVVFKRHPAVPFLLLLAIASNVLAFVAVAPRFHLIAVRSGGTPLLLCGLALAAALRLRGVRSFLPYFLGAGTLLWCGFYLRGLHPALALIPLVPFLPHEPRGADMFKDAPHGGVDSPSRAEHIWKYPAQVVLLLFGLVNAGILVTSYGTGTWALLTAALVGRPFGILAGIALGVASGMHLPSGMHRRDLVVLAFAGATGLTMALFFAASVYPIGPILNELKLGALATGAGLVLTFVLAFTFRVGRFSRATNGALTNGKAKAWRQS